MWTKLRTKKSSNRSTQPQYMYILMWVCLCEVNIDVVRKSLYIVTGFEVLFASLDCCFRFIFSFLFFSLVLSTLFPSVHPSVHLFCHFHRFLNMNALKIWLRTFVCRVHTESDNVKWFRYHNLVIGDLFFSLTHSNYRFSVSYTGCLI